MTAINTLGDRVHLKFDSIGNGMMGSEELLMEPLVIGTIDWTGSPDAARGERGSRHLPPYEENVGARTLKGYELATLLLE
jgi:hypothetical protein